MKALFKSPGDESFREIIVQYKMKAFQELVGGYVEVVMLGADACVICNEEGRLKGLAHNCVYRGIDYVGTILIIGVDGEDFCDCPISVVMANGGIEA